MAYQPKTLEGWETQIAFTIVELPFDTVEPVASGVIRARQGPSGKVLGERRPPMMVSEEKRAKSDADEPFFEGALVYSPAEAPHLTVIEHPLDWVSSEGLPKSLAKRLAQTRLITFDSVLETRHRQMQGFQVRIGATLLRHAYLSRGFAARGWDWDEEGAPLPFEDAMRLAKKRIWERHDRALMFDYAAKLGLKPERSLFGRDFAQSVHYVPLPFNDPEAASDMADIDPSAARQAGVEPDIGIFISDAEYPEYATLAGAMQRWERALDQARVKAWNSARNAKTPKGRERAQWRVIEVIREVTEDMRKHDIAEHQVGLYFSGLKQPMRELGKDTEAYRIYRGLQASPFWMFWKG